MESLSRSTIGVGLPQNSNQPSSLGNVSSGHELYTVNGSHDRSIKGVASAEIETGRPPRGHGDRDYSNIDPKRLKRIMASRQYSQKYRLKQIQYISELETEVKALQAKVAIHSPRIKYSHRQNLLLKAENNSIKQKLSAFSCELMYKEAEYEELKKERDILKQLMFEACQQQEQQLPEMLINGAHPGNHPLEYHHQMGLNQPHDQSCNDHFVAPGFPQMVNQNSVQFGGGDFVEYFNPLNPAGSS